MADVVRLTEDIAVASQVVIGILDGLAISIFIGMTTHFSLVSSELCISHDIGARSINLRFAILLFIIDVHCHAVHVGLSYEQFLLIAAQQIPIPIADGVVFVVSLTIDNHLLAIAQRFTRLRIVSITTWHHVQQLHLTM